MLLLGKNNKLYGRNGKLLSTYDPVLANNSWAGIQKGLRAGNPAGWQVGDIKPLTLTNGDTYTIRLVDLQEGRYVSTDGIKCKATFEFVECLKGIERAMNSSEKTYEGVTSYTAGGWLNSDMRAYIKSDVIPLIPEDLSNVMLLNKVGSASYGGSGENDTEKGGKIIYSDGDKLFLATQSELDNNCDYSKTVEIAYPQFDYYRINGTYDVAFKHQLGNTDSEYYWNRSPSLFEDDSDDFCVIDCDGVSSSTGAYYSCCIAPCFTL